MWWWLIVLVLLQGVATASATTCYPPGGVAGIVVATIVVTCVVGGLGAALAWRYWWTPRQMRGNSKRSDQHDRHQPQKNPTDFAFDNPYFRNQEVDDIDGTGKNKSSMNNKNSLRSSKLSEASAKAKKARGGKNHFGFGGGKKQKALDDSCIASVEPERTFVSLRGHDFTGLGFNICGNMRDGILVKDVLHRGPASESGLIKAGDKIINVTVSFTNIVYEDALTILSYASPYDVQLEIERLSDKSRITPSGSKRLGSCSFNNSGQKLFHPLYRSQSIDDLTQIDRDTFPSHGIGPRRSQSVGVAAHKLASHFKNSDSKLEDKERNPVSLILSTTGSLNEKMLANVMTDGNLYKKGLQWEKRFEDTLESDDSSSHRPEEKFSKRKTTSSNTPDRTSDSKKDSKAYLDYPHNRLKLETKRVDSPRNDTDAVSTSVHNMRRGKTVAEVSTWQRDQDGDVSDHNSARESSKREKFLGNKNVSSDVSKGRSSRRGDEEIDSDVSRDSLELSHRGYQKRNKTTSSSALEGSQKISESHRSESPFADRGQLYPKKMEHPPILKNASQLTESQSKSRTERIYANEIESKQSKSTRAHSNSLSSNDEQSPPEKDKISYSKTKLDAKHGEEDDSVDYGGVRDPPVKSPAYRNVQNPVCSPYGERQKLSSSDAFTNSYGCNNRIVVNGGIDDHKSKLISNPNSSSNYSKQVEIDNRIRETDTAEDKSVSQQQQKFVKKTTLSPAGGMFTQINPFQMPSKQKNFRPWVGREDLSKHNGAEHEFQGSSRHSNYSDSSGPKFTLKDSAIKHRQF